MKLPSGREIPTDSLADVAEMFAIETFRQENSDEAEETVRENLNNMSFSLGGRESPFLHDDITAIIDAVSSVAEEISGELADKMDEYRPRIGEMIEKTPGEKDDLVEIEEPMVVQALTTPLKDMPDSRPVVEGDLVAALWHPDWDYYIGIVNGEQEVENFGGWGDVDSAHHIIKLMDAEKWRKLYDDMNQAPFMLLAEKLPMITTGDFGPEETLAWDAALKAAVLTWLHWNYPRG